MSNPVDNINNNSNFLRLNGKTKNREVKFKASLAAAEGSLVYPNPSTPGEYTIVDSTAG